MISKKGNICKRTDMEEKWGNLTFLIFKYGLILVSNLDSKTFPLHLTNLK